MANTQSKTENIYKCDTCHRSTRVPVNKRGIEVVHRCIITSNCAGKMLRMSSVADVSNTPTFPPDVAGLDDWSARTVLYTHTQSVKAATWIVPHKLENNPSMYVYIRQNTSNSNDELILVEPLKIEIIDLNTARITFSQAEAGLVQCVALSSQTSATPSTLAQPSEATASLQVTNAGELTIATLDPSTLINFKVMFDSPSSPQPIVIEYLNVPSTPSVLSPWADVNYVTVNGKRYYVRSLNVIATPPAPVVFQAGLITSGAVMSFPTIINTGEVLILLANTPHATADRIYDRYIDTAAVRAQSRHLYYTSSNIHATSNIIKNTYPPITTG